MTKPTKYQLDKLVGMYKLCIAELARMRALAAEGKKPDAYSVKKLIKATRAVERLEKAYDVKSSDLLSTEDQQALHALKAPLHSANDPAIDEIVRDTTPAAGVCLDCGDATCAGAVLCSFCDGERASREKVTQ